MCWSVKKEITEDTNKISLHKNPLTVKLNLTHSKDLKPKQWNFNRLMNKIFHPLSPKQTLFQFICAAL